jgi:protein TonB
VKPKEIEKAKLDYPPMARANKVQGTITVEAYIDETGRVTSAKVVRGISNDYGLGDAAVKAALQTKYSPAIKDGVPVKTIYTYPMVFRIQAQ